MSLKANPEYKQSAEIWWNFVSLINSLTNKNSFVKLVSMEAGHELENIDKTWQRAFSVFDVSFKCKQMLLHKAKMYGKEMESSGKCLPKTTK